MLNLELNGEIMDRYQSHGTVLKILSNGEEFNLVFLSGDLDRDAEIGDDIIKHKGENKCLLIKSDRREIECQFYYEHTWCK